MNVTNNNQVQDTMNKISNALIISAIIFALASAIAPNQSTAQSYYEVAICEAVSEIAETAATSYYEDFSVSNYYQSLRLCRDGALIVEIEAYCEVMHDNAWRLPRFTNADQQARRIADYKRTTYLLCLGIYSE